MVGSRGEQHLAVAQGVAEHAHLGLGPKGASEQPVGMQALQPLPIESIGFGAAGGALGWAGVGQYALAAAGEEALRDEGEGKSLCGVSWQPPKVEHRCSTAVGAGVTEKHAVSQTGSGQGLSPVLWSPPPETNLTNGHTAPMR